MCRPDLILRIDAALDARADLLSDARTNVARLLNGQADGIDGLVIERLGKVLIAQLHEGRLTIAEDVARNLCEHMATRLNATAVYRKVFPKDRAGTSRDLERLHTDPVPWIGEPAPEEFAVIENGLTFLIRAHDGYATGLYMDHRASRALIRDLAPGHRVLNAFAYTCGFTVAAAVGGAASTTSVDSSTKHLEWGKRNLIANGQPLSDHRFIGSDIFDYYRRAQRQNHRFDLIILDPPTFARQRRPHRTFSLAQNLEELVMGAVDLLEPGGHLHLSVNHRGTSTDRLRQVTTSVARARGRRCRLLPHAPLPPDFRGDADYAKSALFRVD